MTFQNLPTINSEDTQNAKIVFWITWISLGICPTLLAAMPSEPIGGLYRKVVIGIGPRYEEDQKAWNWCRLETDLKSSCFCSVLPHLALEFLSELYWIWGLSNPTQGKEQSHRTSFMTGHLLWQARLHSLVVMIVQKLSLCEAWLRTGGTWKSKMTISVHSLLWKPLQLMIDWMIRFLFEGQTAYWARAARQTFEALVQTARVWENLMYIRMIRFHINEWCGQWVLFRKRQSKGTS